MKKLILAAVAATIAAGPLAAASADAQVRHQTTTVREGPRGRTVVTTRTWRTGDRFDSRRAANYRRLNDWRRYRLAAPQRGYYWARSGRDAVLVRPNGQIVSVRTRVF